MLLSIVYFALRCLLQLLAPSSRDDLARDVELLVLRHQLKVLSRRRQHPLLRRRDRIIVKDPTGVGAEPWVRTQERQGSDQPRGGSCRSHEPPGT